MIHSNQRGILDCVRSRGTNGQSKTQRKGLYTPKTNRKAWITIASKNSTGAFEAASIIDPTLSDPILGR